MCFLLVYTCLWKQDYRERARKTNPFPVGEKATGSWFLSGGAAVTQHCQVKSHLPSLLPPPVKLIVHLLGSHSSHCSPERDNWIPYLWPQWDWWMPLMGFYHLMDPLSSSFCFKSNLLSHNLHSVCSWLIFLLHFSLLCVLSLSLWVDRGSVWWSSLKSTFCVHVREQAMRTLSSKNEAFPK